MGGDIVDLLRDPCASDRSIGETYAVPDRHADRQCNRLARSTLQESPTCEWLLVTSSGNDGSMITQILRLNGPAMLIEIAGRRAGEERGPAEMFCNEAGVGDLPDQEHDVETVIEQCRWRVRHDELHRNITI
jgi:hypothetical protein